MPTASPSRDTTTSEPVRSRNARARTLKTLHQWIDNGTLAHGHPLPGERELAAQLEVNRNTLRAALAMLDEEGLLRSNGGRLRVIHAPASKDKKNHALEHTIAVLAPDEGQLSPFRQGSGWAEQTTQGVLSRLRAEGLHALVLNPDRVQESDMARIIASRPFGVILTEVFSDQQHLSEILSWLQLAQVPCAVFGDGPRFSAYDRVVSDHEAGAYSICCWLISQGRRRILPLWSSPADGYWLTARRSGYERAMREAHLEPLPSVVAPLTSQEFSKHENMNEMARSLCGQLVEHLSGTEPIDAIMLASDGLTRVTQQALHLFNRQLGKDVLLAGYDNFWAEIQNTPYDPSVPQVTVDKCNYRIGEELVNLLVARVQGTLPDAPQRYLVKPELIVIPKAEPPKP